MTFSRKKIQLGSEVEFGGYQISQTNGPPVQRPLPRKVTVIQDYPEPRDEPEMKRFLGLCAQFSKKFPGFRSHGQAFEGIAKEVHQLPVWGHREAAV